MRHKVEILLDRCNAFQLWMEGEITSGHIDIEQTPECFDRAGYLLKKEELDTHTIGSHCHWCDKAFKENEAKGTNNHIMWFHVSCKEKYEKMEGKNEQFEQDDDGHRTCNYE